MKIPKHPKYPKYPKQVPGSNKGKKAPSAKHRDRLSLSKKVLNRIFSSGTRTQEVVLVRSLIRGFVFQGWVQEKGQIYLLASILYHSSEKHPNAKTLRQELTKLPLDQIMGEQFSKNMLEKLISTLQHTQIVRILQEKLGSMEHAGFQSGQVLDPEIIFGEKNWLTAMVPAFGLKNPPDSLQNKGDIQNRMAFILGLMGGWAGGFLRAPIKSAEGVKSNFDRHPIIYIMCFSALLTILLTLFLLSS